MKGNKLLIALVVVLGAVAAYFYFSKSSGTLDKEFKDFAIKDTASIDRIFIADAQGNEVTLTKKDKFWVVNDQYNARMDNIQLLLKTFHRIDVKSPVPKTAFDNVVKNMASGATKVEIYTGGDQPEKVYFVGNATMDQQGTYMLLEKDGIKSSVPFVMHIPGFFGYLSTRFYAEEQLWRDGTVFRYTPDEIKSISVQYFEDSLQSFVIDKNGNDISLKNFYGGTPIAGFDTVAVLDYISRYKKVYFEMIDMESTQQQKDSVLGSTPIFTITVTDVADQSNKITGYHMQNFRDLLDHDGTPFEYDVDRMYGHLNNQDFTYIQFATFDQITVPAAYFFKKFP